MQQKKPKELRRSRLQSDYNTIFDAVFHTIVIKLPQLVIPLINHVFDLNFSEGVEIIQLKNEFYEKNGTLISDSIYRIGKQIFHFECQSNPDSTMSIRMFNYDIAIAISHARKVDNEYSIDFPYSMVIYLRHNSNTPDEHIVNLNFPDGIPARYKTKAIKVQNYTKEEIFENDLLLFLPFYIMRYEKNLDKYTEDNEEFNKLLQEFETIRQKLAARLCNSSAIYDDLISFIIQISDYIFRKHEKLKERMNKLMGGEILELFSEKNARLDKQLAEAEQRLAYANQQAAEAEQQVAEAEQQVAYANQQVAEAEQRLAEANELNAELTFRKAAIIEQSSKAKTIAIITNMLKADFAIKTIATITDCSVEEVFAIKQTLVV